MANETKSDTTTTFHEIGGGGGGFFRLVKAFRVFEQIQGRKIITAIVIVITTRCHFGD